MKEFDKFVEIVEKLRSKKGCPWDRKQTHKTLKPYVIEEAYEILHAINICDDEKLKNELGDLLLQVVLHAQIAKERKVFAVKDVIKSISEKMVRRHPHVFAPMGSGRAKKKVSGVSEVWKNWEQIKKEEGEYRSILDSIPRAMPALYRADKTQKKAARIGFDWDSIAGAWDKVFEELKEIKILLNKAKKSAKGGKTKISEEIGDLLFSVVNVSRKLQLDAEEVLQAATAKFSKRFKYIEDLARKKNIKLQNLTLEQIDALWEKAKKVVRIKK